MLEDRSARGSIKVLLADDHTMFRQGLAGVLNGYAGMEIVGQTTNDDGAVELALLSKPDVVLMQVQRPISKAKANLKRMRQIDPSPKVVLVTMIEDPRYVRELMELELSAYVVKSASTEHLVAAIRTAILDPKSKNVVVGMPPEILEEADGGSGGTVSARELEILLLAARGLSNRQIAESLHLSEATVKRHLANIYEKMEVQSRGEATRKALLEEWITIQDVTDHLYDDPFKGSS